MVVLQSWNLQIHGTDLCYLAQVIKSCQTDIYLSQLVCLASMVKTQVSIANSTKRCEFTSTVASLAASDSPTQMTHNLAKEEVASSTNLQQGMNLHLWNSDETLHTLLPLQLKLTEIIGCYLLCQQLWQGDEIHLSRVLILGSPLVDSTGWNLWAHL